MSQAALRVVSKEQNNDRKRALDAALSQIDRAFGKGSVMKLGSRDLGLATDAVSTGSLGLDIALGIGGLPRGRVIEVYGPESSGKTTLALHVVAEIQRKGGTAAYVDAEHALDPVYASKLGVDINEMLISQPDTGEQALEICDTLVRSGGVAAYVDAEHAMDPVYARKLGVDIDEMLISQPDTGEQALEITDTLVRSGGVDIVVIDSVAALTPKAELEGEMGDSLPGLQARLMSQALRKLTGSISKSNTIVLFINQIRMKIGVMFGNPETTTGGNALKFYASVRLDIRRIGAIKERDEVVGNQTRVKVVKNKLAPPFKQVEFDIMYGVGISKVGELVDLGVKAGIVEKSGSWYSYDGSRIGQGRESAKTFLSENADIADKIEHAIRAASGQISQNLVLENSEKSEDDEEE